MTGVKRDERCPHCGRYNSRHTVTDGIVVKDQKVLLVKRGIEPSVGKWALPGGYLGWDETLAESVVREVKEECGIDATIDFLVGTYSSPKRRDVVEQNVAVVYALTPHTDTITPQQTEIEEVKWFDLEELPEDLAFDHKEMIDDYRKKVGEKYGK